MTKMQGMGGTDAIADCEESNIKQPPEGYSCGYCKQSISNKCLLFEHIVTQHFTLDSERNIRETKRRLSIMKSKRVGLYRCQKCAKVFSNKRAYHLHKGYFVRPVDSRSNK